MLSGLKSNINNFIKYILGFKHKPTVNQNIKHIPNQQKHEQWLNLNITQASNRKAEREQYICFHGVARIRFTCLNTGETRNTAGLSSKSPQASQRVSYGFFDEK
ncbi:Pectinesterase-3 precursor [Dorcoceras hygrometricum]|uniref:Pectinesterase-3 n=1 Tax=Dorcoceras hygrometricum TaxID=472368 RepID=A0A2Z6ZWL8_9LAMI|nr:Pectinesterase-3 precursor [Dorcoceras hygrometricum]